jgi:predicted transcriptional regulator
MLLIATVKVRKTRIMYQANLSFRLMEKYLSSLLASELLECDDVSCYLITSKGKGFLQLYDDYLERCRKVDEEISGAQKDALLLEDMCLSSEVNSKRISNRKNTAF